jgi:Domain of unknown function (DUF4384)/Putative peptidoglycan binding domain
MQVARASGLIALCAALFASACSTPMDPRRDAPYQSQASVADRPVVRPTRSISSFSESLVCMDHMLRSAEIPTTLIASKSIPDVSGRVSVSAKDMIITALSQMSRLSNAFRVVDYEVDIARQDTVQNLTTIMLNTNQVQLQRPALYISGAIAFVDQNVLSNTLDAAVSGARADVAFSQNRNATIIGLEMHLGDFRTRTLIPGMDSANEVTVGGGGQGVDLGGRIGTYGVKFNVGRDYTQGSGAAVRTLVELATIELIGKWARVPYWQCLTLEQTHPDFQRQLRDWYNEGGPALHSQLLRRSLITHGYVPADGDRLADNDPLMREALSRFQADSGLVVTGAVDFETYERALRHFATLDANGALAQVGWSPTDPAPRQPRTMDMQIENIKVDRTLFETGEQIFLSATVSRSSFVSCYYADSAGTVTRVLPNGSNRSMWVSANQAIRIPDWMSPNPGFLMDAGRPGAEGVACFATDDEGATKLPAAMRESLKPIAGMSSLEQVNKAYADAWGPDGYTTKSLQWRVEARQTPPATATAPAKK